MEIDGVTPVITLDDVERIKRVEDNWNKGEVSTVSASTDRDALTLWIRERSAESEHTRASYIREVNKLIHWSTHVIGKGLTSLTREDMFAYKEFIANPPEHLCGPKRANTAADWKPFFSATPSTTSVRQSFGIVCAMFTWLKSTGYLKLNPVEKMPRQTATPKWRRRSLSDDTIFFVGEFLDDMPKATPLQSRRYHRLRWMFHLFRLTGMRISEVQATTMGNFFSETRGGKSRMFLDVLGKGGKERDIPVMGELLDELNLYRLSVGLSPYPIPHEKIPLICGIDKNKLDDKITRQAIHNAIKYLVGKVTLKLSSMGHHEDAAALQMVSAHWLRHTYATNLLDKGVSLKTARDNLGHADISTTGHYSHSDLDNRFDETEKFS